MAQHPAAAGTPIERLYEASLTGNTVALNSLLEDNASARILDRCIFERSNQYTQSPVHVSASLGHVEFTRRILDMKPELAEVFDEVKTSSPLHMASAKGHLQVIDALLHVKPEMSFAYDRDGRTPIHVAAVNGHTEVLMSFLQTIPLAVSEPTTSGETVLHLCVKYNRLNVLKFLVEITDGSDLLNSQDSNGNTVLHLAVMAKQNQTIRYLLGKPRMSKNAKNKYSMTAMDTHKQGRKDRAKDETIRQYLSSVSALPASDVSSFEKDITWVEGERSTLLVVASLIATMLFQAGINPPGGFWQDNPNPGAAPSPTPAPASAPSAKEVGRDVAGTSILSSTQSVMYFTTLICNILGFQSSLYVMHILMWRFIRQESYLIKLKFTLYVAMVASSCSYMWSVVCVAGRSDIIAIAVIPVGLVVGVYVVRFISSCWQSWHR